VTHEIRQRILRSATPEEKERHQQIREQVEQEVPELAQWARAVAARHRDRVTVGTVFTAQEADVVEAIDDYAARHALGNRGAVVREALSRLLGVRIADS
jgi:acetyl-CoA carboxylase alpha subunit